MGCTRDTEIKHSSAGWCVFPPFFNIWIQKEFPLRSLFWFFSETQRMWGFCCDRAALGLLQRQGGAGESIQRVEYIIIYSILSPWQLMCSSFSTSCSVLGAPLGFSGCLKGLWNEKVLQWILSFFSGCKLWVRSLSQISGVFFWSLPTLMEWFLEAGWVCDTL